MALRITLSWAIPYLIFLSVLDFTTPGKAFTIYGVSQIIALILWAIAEQKIMKHG